MVPDVVVPPPPPPPPMPSATYVPPKPALAIVRNENVPSVSKNPLATTETYNDVINEIKNKSGTLRKTKRKEVVSMEDCIVSPSNLKPIMTAKPTFKHEIVINVLQREAATTLPLKNNENITKTNGEHLQLNGTAFKLRRPSEFLNGTKPELPAIKKEVLNPPLPPKSSVNGINQENKSTTNSTKTIEYPKPSVVCMQPPTRKQSLVSSTIQRLTSIEPDSPTDTVTSPFKRNQVLSRSTSGGISSAIHKLEQQSAKTDSSGNGTPPGFKRSNSVRQKVNQMNRVQKPTPTIKDGTQTIGRRAMVSRPNMPRPSSGTIKLCNELQNLSIARVPLHNQNGNNIVRLENEEARIGTTINVSDVTGTVTTSDPNVKKMVYSTYRNFLGAYNVKANNVVANQNETKVVLDKGVAAQLGQITQNGYINNLTGRAIQKTDD